MNLPARFLQLHGLLDVARLGAQFPDATRWRSLIEVLQRGGPRGKPLPVRIEPNSGLVTRRTLFHLHRLQFVAREFFKQHRTRPSKEARAFSMALAAVDLPPLAATSVRLVNANRFQIVHEVLALTALRFTFTVETDGRGPIKVGKDQLATPQPPLTRALTSLAAASAPEAWRTLAEVPGLTVREVLRGELGPFFPLAERTDALGLALAPRCTEHEAVLSVTLQRVAPDVARPTLRDAWPPVLPTVAGAHCAHERRLFCTPGLTPALRTLAGKLVLVRSSA